MQTSGEKHRLHLPFSTRWAGVGLAALLLLWWGVLLILSPLILGYTLALLAVVWLDWHPRGKDTLVVHSGRSKSKSPLEAIQPTIQSRFELLDWDVRNNWPRWSAGAKLFRLYAFFYGPEPFALEGSLPIILLFPRFRKPRFFVLGGFSIKREENLRALKVALALPR